MKVNSVSGRRGRMVAVVAGMLAVGLVGAQVESAFAVNSRSARANHGEGHSRSVVDNSSSGSDSDGGPRVTATLPGHPGRSTLGSRAERLNDGYTSTNDFREIADYLEAFGQPGNYAIVVGYRARSTGSPKSARWKLSWDGEDLTLDRKYPSGRVETDLDPATPVVTGYSNFVYRMF
jgi:hypothetical protein